MKKISDKLLSGAYYAWDEFVITGQLNNHKVKSPILDSWKRCRQIGVSPFGSLYCKLLNNQQINELIMENEELINVARPSMYELYKFLEGSGFIVMLTDAEGYALEILGDNEIIKNASRLNFTPGCCWQEAVAGTNGIGIVVNTKEPIQVSGAEHYCIKNHGWTSSAAPIFGNSNDMIGILNVSGHSGETHLHTLGMVMIVAEAIEQAIRLKRQNNELLLINQRFANIFSNISNIKGGSSLDLLIRSSSTSNRSN